MLGKLIFSMRTLVTVLLALLFLCCASFPDSIIPPDPAAKYAEGLTIHYFHDKMWFWAMLPLEFWVIIGPKRNRVWFCGVLPVFIIALLAWPVLSAIRPELVHATHSYQGGMLTTGLGIMAIYVAASSVVRLVLAHHLFPEQEAPAEASGDMEVSVLDSLQPRTVEEIAANPQRPAPKFLFGEADMKRIIGFRAIISHYFRMKRVKLTILIFLLLLGSGWVLMYPQPTEEEALRRDLQLMYNTRTLRNGQTAATPAAVHAAYRVMNYISRHEAFAGYTPAQAEQWLGLDRVPEAYRRMLRDERDIELASVDNLFESRTRFLTVTDGRRWAVLYIRTNAEGDKINVAEAQDAGWNAVVDEERRNFGMEFGRDRLR